MMSRSPDRDSAGRFSGGRRSGDERPNQVVDPSHEKRQPHDQQRVIVNGPATTTGEEIVAAPGCQKPWCRHGSGGSSQAAAREKLRKCSLQRAAFGFCPSTGYVGSFYTKKSMAGRPFITWGMAEWTHKGVGIATVTIFARLRGWSRPCPSLPPVA